MLRPPSAVLRAPPWSRGALLEPPRVCGTGEPNPRDTAGGSGRAQPEPSRQPPGTLCPRPRNTPRPGLPRTPWDRPVTSRGTACWGTSQTPSPGHAWSGTHGGGGLLFPSRVCPRPGCAPPPHRPRSADPSRLLRPRRPPAGSCFPQCPPPPRQKLHSRFLWPLLPLWGKTFLTPPTPSRPPTAPTARGGGRRGPHGGARRVHTHQFITKVRALVTPPTEPRVSTPARPDLGPAPPPGSPSRCLPHPGRSRGAVWCGSKRGTHILPLFCCWCLPFTVGPGPGEPLAVVPGIAPGVVGAAKRLPGVSPGCCFRAPPVTSKS